MIPREYVKAVEDLRTLRNEHAEIILQVKSAITDLEEMRECLHSGMLLKAGHLNESSLNRLRLIAQRFQSVTGTKV